MRIPGKRMSRMHSLMLRILGLVCLAGLQGCIADLTAGQSGEMMAYQSRGLAVTERDETTAMWWGIAPGGGSFYTGRAGSGIADIFLWPVSIAWETVNGGRAARIDNYIATMLNVSKLRASERDALDERRSRGEIDATEYERERLRIIEKYDVLVPQAKSDS
jgi:hypothetical protein